MSRAPFVIRRPNRPSRSAKIEDTTIGWRFVIRPRRRNTVSIRCPRPLENVALQFGISRADQDAFAIRSQARYRRGAGAGFFDGELVPVEIPAQEGRATVFAADEHPRETTLEALAKLRGWCARTAASPPATPRVK